MAKTNKKKEKAPEKLKREEKKKLPPASVGGEEEITPPAKLRSKKEEDEVEDEDTDLDYLRKYQYKSVNNTPTLGGVLTDPDQGSKAERMKMFLLGQKRVSMLIPLKEGSDPKVLYSITLNGYRLDFHTNTYIDVPEQVAEVVRNSNSQTVLALNRDRIGLDNKNKENVLG